jgi:sialic acid synthase SpsE
MRSILLDSKIVGDFYPTFIIAEIGGNFSDLESGIRHIKYAISCGVNAVKIQTFRAEKLVSKYATFDMPAVHGKKNQLEIIQDLEVDYNVQRRLFNYCKKKKITFFSTPSHKDDVDFLEECNNKIYKIGSDDLTNIPLIKYIAKLQKPTIISTGMSTINEVRDAVRAFYSMKNKNLVLLHCVSMYPFEPEFANLNAIITMKKKFKIPVGWSDHTKGIDICITAAALGANIIEKHFTLDKRRKGPDHQLSADPSELSHLISKIRIIEKAKGSGLKIPAKCELSSLKNIRKSLVASFDIEKGNKITRDLVEIKRIGKGISPSKFRLIMGKTAIKKISKDRPILMKYLR